MCSYRVHLFFAALLTMAAMTSASGLFYCHGDVCNMGDRDQFCSEKYKICRNCEEIRGECFHQNLPQNCTTYCLEIALQEKMKKEREKPCPPLSNITNGDHNGSAETDHASGTKVVTTCHSQFHIVGHGQTVCGDFGIWSPALPSCEPDASSADVNLTIPLAVLSAVLGFGHLVRVGIICWRYSRRRRERSTRQTDGDVRPRNSLDTFVETDEQETRHKLIEDKDDQGNDTSHNDEATVEPHQLSKTMLPPRRVSKKDIKQSESAVPDRAVKSNKDQATKSKRVGTTADKSELQELNPAPNVDYCRPEQLDSNGSVRCAPQLDTSALFNHGSVQEAGPVSCPPNAHAGKHQPTLDQMRPRWVAPPHLSVTTNGVQPTSAKITIPFVDAEGPPVVNSTSAVAAETGHHHMENGDYKNVKVAISRQNICTEDIKNKL